MNKNKSRYIYRSLAFAVLCSLLFCACGQEMEPLQCRITVTERMKAEGIYERSSGQWYFMVRRTMG